jgi:hypothetical protein
VGERGTQTESLETYCEGKGTDVMVGEIERTAEPTHGNQNNLWENKRQICC